MKSKVDGMKLTRQNIKLFLMISHKNSIKSKFKNKKEEKVLILMNFQHLKLHMVLIKLFLNLNQIKIINKNKLYLISNSQMMMYTMKWIIMKKDLYKPAKDTRNK